MKNAGKEKCNLLKSIRKRIAEKYNLKYHPTECTHQGDCRGTCPACDAELQDLQKQLDAQGIQEVEKDGEKIYIEEVKGKVGGCPEIMVSRGSITSSPGNSPSFWDDDEWQPSDEVLPGNLEPSNDVLPGYLLGGDLEVEEENTADSNEHPGN